MTEPSTRDPHEELASLRRRTAELETALREAEQRNQALSESESRLALILDGSNDGGWDWNIATGEAFLSAGWLRIAGYGPDELPGNVDTWYRLMHPDDAPAVSEALNAFLSGKTKVYEAENRLLHKSGKLVWILNRGKVVERDADGTPTRMTGTITDVTRQRVAEDNLRSSQALLRGVIENSPAAIGVQDRAGHFILTNKHFVQMRDKGPNAADGGELSDDDRRLLEAGQTIVSEEERVRDGEVRTFLSTRFSINDAAGKPAMLGTIATDITDRKRAEEERAALQRRIIEAQRATLLELSTPLLPIAEGVLVVPLIGVVDSQRAQQFTEVLLHGVAAHRTRSVIIDITGAGIVDTVFANALVRASRAVKLLGVAVVITGIQPHVASTLVNMGAELGSVVVHGSLQDGIAHTLRR